jgi:glycosyltransferase involved in cell wall biosynthesis
MMAGHRRPRVMHVISGLNAAGAEGALFRIVSGTEPSRHVVVSLTDEGAYGPRLMRLGTRVYSLSMQSSSPNLLAIARLVALIRQNRPDVVQTWMYHADLLGGVAARLAGRKAIVWGIRHSRVDGNTVRRSTRLIAAMCARLSHFVPSLVVSCSEVAACDHVAEGYDCRKMLVVANGFDLSTFRPDGALRAWQRSHWAVADDDLLLGMVARWHPQKDHSTLFTALHQLKERTDPRWRLVLVGSGMYDTNANLLKLIQMHGLQRKVILAGCLHDMPAVMNAIDIHVLSSCSGEAFPNVVAESMACGTPGVVTAVGDAAAIVDDTGWIVPARAPHLLAQALEDATTSARDRAGWAIRRRAARQRIEQNYDIRRMQQGFEKAWARALADTAA